ncbi:MAG: hypothetical protein Q7T61_00590 [Caulobacter sp.]|nr:hypothetical protein [Caulobacter sp.]
MDQFETDPVGYLMRRKFPPRDRTPRIYNPNALTQTPPEQRSPEATSYLFHLKLMSQSELRQAAAEERAREVAEWVEKAAADDRTQFFSQPNAVPDLDHWARMDFWSLEEALALSFGKAPEVLTAKRVTGLSTYSPFAVEYRRRAEVARRAVVAKQMWESVRPSTFLRWAQRKGMNPPTELVEAVEAAGGDLRDWQDFYNKLKEASDRSDAAYEARVAAQEAHIAALQSRIETVVRSMAAAAQSKPSESPAPVAPELRTRERDSLLKLVIGMAVGAYSYDPKAGRSPTVSEIADDLARAGVSLDADTVRKYVTEAKQYLPDQG